MEVYLVTYDGTEYQLSETGSGYQTLLESLLSGDGAVPLEYVFTRNAFTDKDDLVRISSKPRIVTIPVTVLGSSADSLMTGLKALYKNIKVDKVSYSPMRIKVVSNNKTAYLDVYPYGEEVQEIAGARGRVVSLSFIAPDPMWYTDGTAEVTLREMVVRLSSNLLLYHTKIGEDNTETWLARDFESAEGNFVRAIEKLPWADNQYVLCGKFAAIKGITRNHLCVLQTPNTLLPFVNSNYSFNDQSTCVKTYGSQVYFGGKFTQVNGANGGSGIQANRVALYDKQLDWWEGLNSPITGTDPDTEVFSLDVDRDGNLYVGGYFTTTTGNYLLKYNGSAWSAPWGEPSINGTVQTIAIGSNGNIYIGGDFTLPYSRLAKWDGSQWESLGSANDTIYKLAFGPDGNLYACGKFTSIGGVTAKGIAMWNGTRWYEIGGGVISELGTYPMTVFSFRFDERGNLYITGNFTKAGDVPANSVAMWDGSRWHGFDLTRNNIDVKLYYAIYPIDQQELLIGASVTEALHYETGLYTKVTSPSPQKPTFKIYGSGYFGFILNATTGQRLEFNINLLAGEVLTIDTEKLTATSNARGNMLPYLDPSSNFADFMLLQGDNYLTGYLVNDAVCVLKNKYSTLGEAVG